MEDLIKKIALQKIPIFFVSPHLDDAALSCGELIRKLSTKTQVTVINVFTRANNGKQTLSAKKTVRVSNFPTPLDLYNERVSEDKKALESINAKIINLGFVDALWRKIKYPSFLRKKLSTILPELIHVYPTFRLHISKGKLAREDNDLIIEINESLKKIIPENSIIFCPFGVGNHVDHLVTKKAVEKTFTPIYWMDQPYFEREKSPKYFCHSERSESGVEESHTTKLLNWHEIPPRAISGLVGMTHIWQFKANNQAKSQLLAHYNTQINLMFPNGKIPDLKEIFITKQIL